ncbi:AAA family ATPase, partial [Candidatus Gracilibacteria bacterium]|nr:AAA family ATPase [Candidatus Gracilibacteria bacterium]
MTTPNTLISLTLRVAEAQTRDVGRGLVRLDPSDIAQIGASVGDVVLVSGQRATVARVMPAYADMRGLSAIQMDGIVRANAGAGLDEQVQVTLAATEHAQSVTLTPIEPLRSASPAQSRYLARLLDRIPVTRRDTVR